MAGWQSGRVAVLSRAADTERRQTAKSKDGVEKSE